LASCQDSGVGKARRSAIDGYGDSSSDSKHPSLLGEAGLEFKPSICELEDPGAHSLLVTELGSKYEFELDAARLTPPLETVGLVVIAEVDGMLEEAELFPPEIAGLAANACGVEEEDMLKEKQLASGVANSGTGSLMRYMNKISPADT
jgi:hypothetical protein